MFREGINATLTSLKKHAVALTYAIAPNEDLIDSMLAPTDGNLFKSIISRITTAPRAFERTESWRDFYKGIN